MKKVLSIRLTIRLFANIVEITNIQLYNTVMIWCTQLTLCSLGAIVDCDIATALWWYWSLFILFIVFIDAYFNSNMLGPSI